jgi:hypothetical protein
MQTIIDDTLGTITLEPELKRHINAEVTALLSKAEEGFDMAEPDSQLIIYLLEMLFLVTVSPSHETDPNAASRPRG